MIELTTVADDEIVAHVPADDERGAARVVRRVGLPPGQAVEVEGVRGWTLPRPGGQLLARVATVNDLHFGEVECGVVEGLGLSPVLRAAPGEAPYPETMNRTAAAEIAAARPDAVVAKGDLTSSGLPEELAAYRACYEAAFGSRLFTLPGNHDVASVPDLVPAGDREVALPGVRLALLDTTIPGAASGRVDREQLEWLDELAARSDRPVLLMGHHHAWDPGSRTRPEGYFGINPSDSEALVGVVARRPSIVAYLAGHTHRNRVRYFSATGSVPWVEVACVKDFPGSWAEYRIFEGGILQIHRRCSDPAALAWSERCRALVGGLYPQYSFGAVEDRCIPIPLRPA